jgi:Electron transfer DM13
MKKAFFILTILAFIFSACNKDKTVAQPIPAGTVVKTGSFVSNSKTTNGTAKIIAGENNTRKLVLENFSTGSGPDVRVWLSASTSATTYQEAGLLTNFNGTFVFDIAPGVDITVNNKVLIWCEDVRILFGHAVLQ